MRISLKPRNPGPLWKLFSSVWLAIGLMIVIAVMCLIGHCAGIKEAEDVFFGSWWFTGVLAALWVNILVCTLQRSSLPTADGFAWPWRLSQSPFLMVHLGLLTMLCAGMITMFKHDGSLYVQEGTKEKTFIEDKTEIVTQRASDGETTGADVHLTPLPKTDDLQTRPDKIAVAGAVFWGIFALAGFAAGAKFGGRDAGYMVAGIVLASGLVFTVGTRKSYRWKLPGGATLTLKTYYPHHSLDEKVTPDETGRAPMGVELLLRHPSSHFRGKSEVSSFWLFPGTDRESMSQGPPGREFEFKAWKVEREAQVAEICGTADVRTATLAIRSKATGHVATFALPQEVGRTLELDGHTVKLSELMKDLHKMHGHGEQPPPEETGSEPLVDPVALLEVTNPDGQKERKVFFLHPPANMGRAGLDPRTLGEHKALDFAFDLPAQSASERSINLLAGPEKGRVRLFLCLHKGGSNPDLVDLAANAERADERFQQLAGIMPLFGVSRGQVLEHARAEEVPTYVDPAEVPREGKAVDAFLARVEDGSGHADEQWISMYPGRELKEFHVGNELYRVVYRHKRLELPFEIELKKFTVEATEGDPDRPAGFRSDVVVHDDKAGIALSYPIYMNHTLDYGGYTFFQSQFEKRPDAPVSIFTVSDDKGGVVFYFGFFFFGVGCFMIFYVKPWLRRVERRRARAGAGLPPESPDQERQALGQKQAPGKRLDDLEKGDKPELVAAGAGVREGVGAAASSPSEGAAAAPKESVSSS